MKQFLTTLLYVYSGFIILHSAYLVLLVLLGESSGIFGLLVMQMLLNLLTLLPPTALSTWLLVNRNK